MLGKKIYDLPLSNGIAIKEYLFDDEQKESYEQIVKEHMIETGCDEITAAKFAIKCYEIVLIDLSKTFGMI